MAFLIPIPVSLVLALLWGSWVSRPRRPAPVTQSVEAYRRALAALAPDHPPRRKR
jgi:hypothetical protein